MTDKKEKKLEMGINDDGNLEISSDFNQDGEKSLKLVVYLSESIQELIARGEAIEGEKVVKYKFGLDGVEISLDTDKDGEKSLDFKLNLRESLDEVGLKI